MKDNAYVRCAFKDSNFKKSVHKLKQRSYSKKIFTSHVLTSAKQTERKLNGIIRIVFF